MNYPKIYSLSTVGIIHHHNCDYLFHSLRTDFTGESGCGKSMISDILQLILAGPAAYESSTQSYGSRMPQNMVFQKSGSGQGYVFLNIALGKQQFVTIGCYIESGVGTVYNFIIHQSFDAREKLTPFKAPLLQKDFIIQNAIPSFDSLQIHMKEKGYFLKRFPIKQYHEILFKNEILPVDLSKSEKTLKTYAQILRSFSRGKVFSKKSKDLKDFLFGDEKERELRKEFDQDVKSVQDDIENHKTLKTEIEIITRKQTSLSELRTLYKDFKENEKRYLKAKIIYWAGKVEASEQNILQKQTDYNKHYTIVYFLQKQVCKEKKTHIKQQSENLKEARGKLNGLVGKKESLTMAVNVTNGRLFKCTRDKENLESLDRFLSTLQVKIDSLKITIEEEQLKTKNKKAVLEFEAALKDKNLVAVFEKGSWTENYTDARIDTITEINSLIEEISELQSMKLFTDVKNEESLAKWGIEYFKRPLSLEEESILIYFQKFPVKANCNLNRFLHSAIELFDNLDLKEKRPSGFWLNLDGVYEFIKYTSTPVLNTEANQQKLKELQQLSGSIEKQITNRSEQLKELQGLLAFFDNIPNIQHIVFLYSSKDQLKQYEPLLQEEISISQLEQLIALDSQRQVIASSLQVAQQKALDSAANLKNYETDTASLNNQIMAIEQYFEKEGIKDSSFAIQEIDVKINNLVHEFLLFKQQQSLTDTWIDEIKLSLTKISDIHMEINTNNASKEVLKIELVDSKTKRNEANTTWNQAKNTYKIQIGGELDDSFKGRQDTIDPEKTLYEPYQKAKAEYEAKFDLTASELEDKNLLAGSYQLSKLASALLPTVIQTSRVDVDNIDIKIAEKLTELNHRASTISERKIEILSKVFSKVYNTYSEYLETVNQIKNYFKRDNRRITGGNRVSLTSIKSKDFPEGWLSTFRKKIDDELSKTGLFAILSKELDIFDMMLKAFKESGGSAKVNADDLLNPKSYFDLEFDLRLENNVSNDGSTGQTYAATALLGIARLSHVEKTSQGKRPKGIRFMPVDEAEGLGSNYNLLYEIAKEENYQIISMSIEPVGDFREKEQYIYILNENPLSRSGEFNPPFAIFSEGEITEDIATNISSHE
jgi:exonuclease SbcC